MGERNLEIEYLEEQLASLIQTSETLKDQIAGTTDVVFEQKMDKRLKGLFKEIDQKEAEIESLRQQAAATLAQARDASLLEILNAYSDELALIQSAYQITISHWPTDLPSVVATPHEVLQQLKRIGISGEYSAQEEFIAHLVHTTDSPELLDALNTWGQQYYPNRNWAALNAQIQEKFEARGQTFQPAILVCIRLAEEKTSQGDNTPHYQPEAYLIEDIEAYQQQGKHRRGYHALAAAETPFTVDEMEAKIQPLLDHWLRQVKQILPDCKNDPEFHVYLPKSLLHLNVDYWPVDTRSRPNRLGHSYKVVICCMDRLEGPYPVGPWQDFWERHQICLSEKACEVFAEGSAQDIDDLLDVLEEAADGDKIVGLKIISAPCQPGSTELTAEADELFEELLLSGLPLAIWGRCQEQTISNPTELGTILSSDTLGNLLEVVQRKRREARKSTNTPQNHIGHHLSLLRDNPTLIPPKRKTA